MMRDYTKIEKYLDDLAQDIYPQPEDEGHTAWANDVINRYLHELEWLHGEEVKTVLDVGCGVGFCQPVFEKIGVEWTGVTLGAEDFKIAKTKGKVYLKDATFLDFDSDSYDLVFARHILEHSPMPLLTLMEWRRISKKFLVLVFPAWEYWLSYGKNHYYMFTKDQLWRLLSRAGWKIVKQEDFTTSDKLFMDFYMVGNALEDRVWNGPPKPVEYRYLCIKGEPQTE